MKTSAEAHKRPIELRVIHGRGCNPQVCEDIDDNAEVCTRGAVLRLKAGLAWRYMMRYEGTPQEAFNNWSFAVAKKRYLEHIYGEAHANTSGVKEPQAVSVL